MKRIQKSKETDTSFKKILNIKPYKVKSYKISAAAMKIELASERMRIANEVAANLIITDGPGEESIIDDIGS